MSDPFVLWYWRSTADMSDGNEGDDGSNEQDKGDEHEAGDCPLSGHGRGLAATALFLNFGRSHSDSKADGTTSRHTPHDGRATYAAARLS